MKKVNFLGRKVPVPSHPLLRIILGVVLCIGGVFGFLPILGFWMLPFGLVILSIDFAIVRRLRRRSSVRLGEYLHRKWPRAAKWIGYSSMRAAKF